MEVGKEYPVFSFSAKEYPIGRYFVAGDNLEAAQKHICNHNNFSSIKLDISSGIEITTLKYICPDYIDKFDAVCIINAIQYIH